MRISDGNNSIKDAIVKTSQKRYDIFDTFDAERINFVIRIQTREEKTGDVCTYYVWFDIASPSACIDDVVNTYNSFGKYEELSEKCVTMLRSLGFQNEIKVDETSVISFLLSEQLEKHEAQ